MSWAIYITPVSCKVNDDVNSFGRYPHQFLSESWKYFNWVCYQTKTVHAPLMLDDDTVHACWSIHGHLYMHVASLASLLLILLSAVGFICCCPSNNLYKTLILSCFTVDSIDTVDPAQKRLQICSESHPKKVQKCYYLN